MATFYERLLEVINNPAITRGDFHLLGPKGDGADEVIAFERRCGDEGRIITAANLSDGGSEVSFSTDALAQLNDYRQMKIVSTELTQTPQLDLWPGGITLRLRAHEGLLLVTRD